jgi:hypothetical protein
MSALLRGKAGSTPVSAWTERVIPRDGEMAEWSKAHPC